MDRPADSRLPTLDRKIQKTGSGCKVALRHHKTTTPGNDSVSRRQFQSGSLALWPGGKKLVNMRQNLLGSSRPSFGHGQHSVLTGSGVETQSSLLLVQRLTRRREPQSPAASHRIPSIQHQIQDHLLQAGNIGQEQNVDGRRQDLRHNVTACQVLQHGSECGHNPVEIHLHQLQPLTPAQRQQVIRERRGLFAGELSLFGATNLVRHSRLTLPQSAHCLIEFGDIEYCADQ